MAHKYYIVELGEPFEDAVDAHCDDPFNCADQALRELPNNVTSRCKTAFVMDENGEVVRTWKRGTDVA